MRLPRDDAIGRSIIDKDNKRGALKSSIFEGTEVMLICLGGDFFFFLFVYIFFVYIIYLAERTLR